MKRILHVAVLLAVAGFAAYRFFPRISMKPMTVLTIPSGADLFFNGVPAGLSPAVRLVPGEGVHVAASKNGFLPGDTLLGTIPDTLVMQLAEGALLIISTTPSGCAVEVGNYTGTAPCSLVVFPGNPVQVRATGPMGMSVTRTVNILSPGTRVLSITVPWQFTDSLHGMDFVVIPRELMPFAMGPMTVGCDEVTAGEFSSFMNSVDPDLLRGSSSVQGRTILLDSIMRCNWNGPVAFNADTTAYAPIPGMEEHPVTGVTQQGAVWFCRWLAESSGTGLEYRLPDSDEWAVLALPGENMPYNHSDRSETILTRNQAVDDGWSGTAPSGAMGYSGWGLGNMQGNVWEWTSENGTAAGGSWISSSSDCTADAVIRLDGELGYPFVGFRVVAAGVPGNIIQTDTSETE